MLTLYHAPNSRSSRIVTLIDEMGVQDKVQIRDVEIHRMFPEGGGPDPANPHPEGKVPLLVDGEEMIRESPAIILYLLERFPGTGLGIEPGAARRGEFLSWIAYYGSVFEPVVMLTRRGIDDPFLRDNYRGLPEAFAAFRRALDQTPWLAGDRYTAADLLLSSAFGWWPEGRPDDPVICDWIDRCLARPSVARTMARDQPALAG
ncbi:glutathione S-transferase [Defluviimonas sp. 20V17]|uniref:Glutathione S-transferase n=2 Tax=Allgaiera indica TaxID=765699 RepID=A0AAN4ZYU1_9RHOB|nr:glutathione S-transferase family protein [Allgaiera indica]KDB02494.1 glutathione S-transferase [Defluviimonas sp. 20V17]GHD98767.1 glutathione S-transferase [Allgaiera indica]SDW06612.1 glutathione S-transferase [Allgaiera indica]